MYYVNIICCAKLLLEIRNSKNYRRLLKLASFPVCKFWALDFVRRFVGFFAVSFGFFAVSKSANACNMHQNDKNCKSCLAAEKHMESNSFQHTVATFEYMHAYTDFKNICL